MEISKIFGVPTHTVESFRTLCKRRKTFKMSDQKTYQPCAITINGAEVTLIKRWRTFEMCIEDQPTSGQKMLTIYKARPNTEWPGPTLRRIRDFVLSSRIGPNTEVSIDTKSVMSAVHKMKMSTHLIRISTQEANTAVEVFFTDVNERNEMYNTVIHIIDDERKHGILSAGESDESSSNDSLSARSSLTPPSPNDSDAGNGS